MQFPENRDVVRGLGADSMVLLKNSGILPLKKGKIALFGAGAVDTLFCGVNFNHVTTDNNIAVKEGLLNNGFTLTTDSWLNKMAKAVAQGERTNSEYPYSKDYVNRKGMVPEVPISVADMAEAILGTDTCIYVVRHGITCANETVEGIEYQLTETEQSNLQLITSSFKNVIFVLNSSMVELAYVARMKSVKGIIYMGLPGMEAGNSLADVLTGAVNPSGRLTTTWAKKYKDYSTCYSPAVLSKSEEKNEIDYKEGIYVGYRYFDAFDVTPLYPFGFGMSYTTFDMSLDYLEASWVNIVFRIKVTNTGDCAGRQVVQLYCSQPEGHIEKPYQILCGFAKTGKLKPGESEEITVRTPMMALACFDEGNSAWICEKGDYLFRLGANSRDTVLCGKVVLDKETVIKRVVKVMTPHKQMEFLKPSTRQPEETGYIKVASLAGDDYNSENRSRERLEETITYVPEGSTYVSYVNDNPFDIPRRTHEIVKYIKPCGTTTFFSVIRGEVSVESFVSSLSPEILARIVAGVVNESRLDSENRFSVDLKINKNKVDVSARTTAQYAHTLGIPSVTIADGPSGLKVYRESTTCFPAPINMAQTWDMSALIRMGRVCGREMEYYGVDYILAPALNIHRNPMRSRAYEFYSEDPTLAGVLGSGFVLGVKRYEGRDVILKNIATYNQESKRSDVNINLSRRAFGELYLRSFAVCQSIVPPGGILNSGNKLNGLDSSSQRGINTDIIRGDFGFNGFVLTDWASRSNKAYDLHAGCDLIMPGYDPDKILEAMMQVEPTFEADGYVTVVEKAFKNGEAMISYEKWGSYILDKNGKERVSSVVGPNVTISDIALRLQSEGLCDIQVQEDGRKILTYRCTNRGAYLSLGDLQQAVIHILNEIKDSAAMQKLVKEINLQN
ncbi:MAG: glycoside hydrolase family 3 C-terminal domain-containing protein [Pseudobutyrivibrio sp.]|nr:glycoside hydrolase family 3 C-terminal domain-containing protein [Pseudobutyrivibrio sp.]